MQRFSIGRSNGAFDTDSIDFSAKQEGYGFFYYRYHYREEK